MRETLKSGGWLTDEHVHLAQELLQRDYPNIQGFQSTLFSQINGFTPVDSDCESLQFHHINGDHWVLSTTIGGEVAIVDSKYSHKLTLSFTHQLAQIYRKYLDSQEDTGCETLLSLRIPRVQQQSGGSDCGIFAIAFAVHLLRGDNIEDIDFDQEKMRSHLNSCFLKEKCFLFLRYPLRDVVSPHTFHTFSLKYIVTVRCQKLMVIWLNVKNAKSGTVTSLIRTPKLRAPPPTRQLLCTLWLGKVSQLANLTAAFG